MLPSPAGPGPGSIPTPNTTAGSSKRSASDLQRSAGIHNTPSKRHATTKASAVAGANSMPAFSVPGAGAGVGAGPGAGTGPGPGAGAGAGAGAVAGAGAGAGIGAPVANMSSLGGLPNSQPLPIQGQPQQPPMTVTEDQLAGRTSDQLIATILQLQSQHQQYVASISTQYNSLTAQYNSIIQQLDDLRGTLASVFTAQSAQLQNAASFQGSHSYIDSRSSRVAVPPPPPMSSQQSPSGPPRIPTSQPTPRAARPLPQSPQDPHTDTRLMPKQSNLPTPQTPGGPPAYDYRTVGTVDEVWREYKHGIDGQPAVEHLDATWGSRWRPEPRGRTWYSRRKVIWDKIKEHIAEGMSDDDAVKEVEKLRDGGTINKLIRMLQDERKDKGLPDDSTAA